jgi:hypothetical protein
MNVEPSCDVVRVHDHTWNGPLTKVRDRAERGERTTHERQGPELSRVPRTRRDLHAASAMHERRKAQAVGVSCIEEILRPETSPLEGRRHEARHRSFEEVFEDAPTLANPPRRLLAGEPAELVGVACSPGKWPNREGVSAVATVEEPVGHELHTSPRSVRLRDQSLRPVRVLATLVRDEREVKSLGTRLPKRTQSAREAPFRTIRASKRSVAGGRDVVHEHQQAHRVEPIRSEGLVPARSGERSPLARKRSGLVAYRRSRLPLRPRPRQMPHHRESAPHARTTCRSRFRPARQGALRIPSPPLLRRGSSLETRSMAQSRAHQDFAKYLGARRFVVVPTFTDEAEDEATRRSTRTEGARIAKRRDSAAILAKVSSAVET